MKIKKPRSTRWFECFAYVVITIMMLFCLFPILLILSGSVTENEYDRTGRATPSQALFPL